MTLPFTLTEVFKKDFVSLKKFNPKVKNKVPSINNPPITTNMTVFIIKKLFNRLSPFNFKWHIFQFILKVGANSICNSAPNNIHALLLWPYHNGMNDWRSRF